MNLLFKLLYKRKLLVFITICSSGLSVAVTLRWNYELSKIIDSVSTGIFPTNEMIIRTLIIMIILSIFNYLKRFFIGYTCESITHDLRMGYGSYFSLLTYREAEELNTGRQISKLQNEIADVSGYLNSNLFQLIDDGVKFIVTFSWLLFIAPSLAIVSNIPVLIIIIYVFWSSKIINTATEQSQISKSLMNQYADTLLTLFPIFKLYDATHWTLTGYINAIEKWKSKNIQMERKKAWLMSMSAVLSSIPLMLLFFIGGQMVINGILTIGVLYIFLNLSGNVSGVMMNMPRYITEFRQFSTNMKLLTPHIFLNGKGNIR